ncbi:MAG: hypothetical protein ACI81Q_001603, partial [Paracoccaceae bacterium]
AQQTHQIFFLPYARGLEIKKHRKQIACGVPILSSG